MVSLETLRRFKMFRDVPNAALARLSETMQLRLIKAGETLSREDEVGRTLYLLVSGSVSVEKKTFATQESKVVAKLGPGEFFGEMSFLQGTAHSATVVAHTDGQIVELTRSALDELIKTDSDAALEQVLTLAAGLSGRLRSTTRELVTVFEVARAIASAETIEDLSRTIVGQLQLDLGADTSVVFYRWNMFNEELGVVEARGKNTTTFPKVIDDPLALARLMANGLIDMDHLDQGGDAAPFPFKSGQLIVTPVRSAAEKFGLFAYQSDSAGAFDSSERQLMETVAAVMIPALSSLQHREEEIARKRLQQNKQGGLTF